MVVRDLTQAGHDRHSHRTHGTRHPRTATHNKGLTIVLHDERLAEGEEDDEAGKVRTRKFMYANSTDREGVSSDSFRWGAPPRSTLLRFGRACGWSAVCCG
jgi:hypothetical protein